MDTVSTSGPTYILGHSPEELKRLIQQATFYNPATRQAFLLAGLEPGMRVLDVGCGVGDLSLIAAEMVGSCGQVVGIDRAREALDVARYRASEAGYSQIEFIHTELDSFEPNEAFDAVVGRLVLLYQLDPVATLSRLKSFLKGSGFMLFQEFDMSTAKSLPVVPMFEKVVNTIRSTFVKAGMDDRLGAKLINIYQEAKLSIPRCTGFQWICAGPDYNTVSYLNNTLKSLWPFAQDLGIVDIREELHLPSMNEKLVKQIIKRKAILYTPLLVSVWAKPI